MFRNHILIAWRILIKNKLFTGINISGLAIGFACCLALGLYIYDEWAYDRFHQHRDHIFRAYSIQKSSGGNFKVAVTPGPLAPSLLADFPEITDACRISKQRDGILEYDNKLFEPDQVLYADHSFFRMFDFKVLAGDPSTLLLKPDEVILSESMAVQCFGQDWRSREDLLGKTFTVNNSRLVTLAGIIQDPPDRSHIQFNMLLSFKYLETNSRGYNWYSNNYHTYVLTSPETNLPLLQNKLAGYLKTKDQNTDGILLSLQPLQDIHLHSDFAFHTDWSKTSSMVYIKIFFAVGLIILSIALFNFINLSTAKAIKRMKEVGVRKTIGAERYQLIIQFFNESVLLACIAILISYAMLLGFIPILNSVAGKALAVPFNVKFIGILVGFALVSGLLAGIYPAVYLSGFKPVKSLKGIFEINSGKLFRQVLVITQFSLSLILILGTCIISRQMNYLQHKDLGFDQSQLLSMKIKTNDFQTIELLKQEISANTNIASVSANSSTLIDVINSTGRVKWQGQEAGEKLMITSVNIDQDYLPTSGIQLLAGRNFDQRTSDTSRSFIINQTAASRMGWKPEEAIGKSFTLWEKQGQIIGVTRDFHFKPLTTTIDAFVFRYWPEESFQYLLIKTKAGHTPEALRAIEKIYKKHDPKSLVQYAFVNELLDNQYRAQQRSGKVTLYFSILAVFISCLGLFGLVTFATEQKIKQIAIRKVLGAGVTSIVTLLSGDFIRLVAIAIGVSVPFSYWIMNSWLQTFAYKTPMSWWMFAGAAALVLVIALITLSFKTIQAARQNPAISIRQE